MSCGQIALDKIGIEIDNYFASEIDKHSIQVTKHNYPNTKHIGDVKQVKGGDLPKIDLVIGGSPCQGFSFAGKHLNFDDPRSKLFFEFVRLLEETKPKYFLLENVKMKKEYQEVITGLLGVQPIMINSNLVSAQNRVRFYWTSIPGLTLPEDKNILLKDVLEDNNSVVGTRHGLEVRTKSKCVRAGGRGSYDRHEWDSVDKDHTRKLTVLECERLQTVPDNYTNHVSNSQRYKMLGNGWTVDVIAHIFKGLLKVYFFEPLEKEISSTDMQK